jgi:chromosome segregation ATPase
METRIDRIEKAIEGLLFGISELKESQKKADEQMRRTDEQTRRTDAKLDRLGRQLADLGLVEAKWLRTCFIAICVPCGKIYLWAC